MEEKELIQKITEKFPSHVVDSSMFRDQLTVIIRKDAALEIMRYLHGDRGFDLLTDLCGVDHWPRHPRFEVVYHLYSVRKNERIRVKSSLEEDETISSVESVWQGANWYEREAFDMLGIVFENHSCLKRILMWDDFDGHPLRKDFPTVGHDFEKPVLPDA